MEKYQSLYNQKWLSRRFKVLAAFVWILIGVTKAQAANITGGVWDDSNGNAIKVAAEDFVNGTTFPLWVNLVDVTTNQVLAVNRVSTGGLYTLTGASNGAVYRLILTTTLQVIGSELTVSTLPVNWVHTGLNGQVNAATGGNTTNKSGIFNVTMPASGNYVNLYFGIERLPTATSVTAASQQNPRGNYKVPVISPSAVDPEDGNLWTIGTGTIRIETLASNGTLYYNNTAVTAGQIITNFNDALLTLDPVDGAVTSSFTYSSIDAAGQQSPSTGTVNIPFTEPVTFACDSYLYQVINPGQSATTPSTLYRYNPFTGARTAVANTGLALNAIGYNTADNLLWGWDIANFKVVRIDATGKTTSFSIPNFPEGGFNIGEVIPGGYLYIYGSGTSIYVVDIDPSRATYLKLVQPTNGYILDTAPYGTAIIPTNISDFAYNPATGLLYAIFDPGSSTNTAKIVTINPTTLATTVSGTTVGGGGILATPSAFGAVFFDKDGNFYVFANSMGKYFRINLATNAATLLSTNTANDANDGASCATVGAFQIDMGDAPDALGTLLNSGGPAHVLSTNLKIGTNVDAELNAVTNATATGDDLNGTPDDEDGLSSVPALKISATTYSITVQVTNTTGANATLSGWVDFNRNNVFATSERVQVTVPNGATSVVLTWTGLSGLVAGQSYIRLRLASDAPEVANPMGDAGAASNGEVEDYSVIIDNGPDLTPTLVLSPSTVVGQSKVITARAVILEVNNVVTAGDVIVLLPTSSHYTLNTFNASQTFSNGLPVQNNRWTYLGLFGSNYAFQLGGTTNTTSIAGGSSSAFGFSLTYNANGQAGIENIVLSIYDGSGGEINYLNNNDSESVTYSSGN